MAYTTTVSLVASAAITTAATTNGTAVSCDVYRRGTFILDVTAVSGSVTLDLAIQTYINGYWSDIARFAQMTATGTRILWDVGGTVGTSSTIEEATQSLAITVSTKRAGPWGNQLRARYTTTLGTSITFSCVGILQS